MLWRGILILESLCILKYEIKFGGFHISLIWIVNILDFTHNVALSYHLVLSCVFQCFHFFSV